MKLAPTITTMARMSIPRWRVFGAACLAHVLHDGYSSMLYLLLPFWQRELALSLTQVGILKTVYSAAMAFGQVPAELLQDAMTDLITNKNYSETERRLHAVDQLMVDLIEDMGGNVIRSGLWT